MAVLVAVGLKVGVDVSVMVGIADGVSVGMTVAVSEGAKVGKLVGVNNWSGVDGKVTVGTPEVFVARGVGVGVKVVSTPSIVGNKVTVSSCGGKVGTGPGAIK